jgi:hypothetical protein
VRLAVTTAILASAALIAAPSALADGDPASDVLVDYPAFNPIGSGVSSASEARLDALLTASADAGFPIRVALIAAQRDLGTATTLWRKPVSYARFLQAELSELYHGQILVVMPNGFGLWGPSGGLHSVGVAEMGVRAAAPGPGNQLAASALAAVPLLAAAAGHPIPQAAIATSRVATVADGSRPSDTLSPAVIASLVIGALLIAIAWIASLRARPPHLPRRLGT